MAISQELSNKIQAAYAEFLGLVEGQYLDNQKNCDAIKSVMIRNGIQAEGWQFAGAWLEAHARASKAGLLELAPVAPTPKTREEINLERERRDRAPGYKGGIREIDETPFQKMTRLEQARQDKIEAERRKAQSQAEAARVAAASSTDVSMVPSVAKILSGEGKSIDDLTTAEQRALSSAQLLKWMQNSNQAKQTIANNRRLEQEKRIKQNA
jgi:hypothetical protein